MKSKTRWFWLVSISLILVLQACSIGPLMCPPIKKLLRQNRRAQKKRIVQGGTEETIAEIEEPTEVIPVSGTEPISPENAEDVKELMRLGLGSNF